MSTERPKLLRVSDVAEMLSISRALVYKWIKEGKIGYIRLPSGTIRVPLDEVMRIIENREGGEQFDNKN